MRSQHVIQIFVLTGFIKGVRTIFAHFFQKFRLAQQLGNLFLQLPHMGGNGDGIGVILRFFRLTNAQQQRHIAIPQFKIFPLGYQLFSEFL